MTDKLVVTAVPRTISRLDKEVRISATLVLRPGTIDDAAQGKNSQLFETWPTTIQKLFAAPGALTAELGVTTAAGKLSQAIKPITSTGRLDHPDIGKDSGFAGLKFADVTTIWSRLLRDDGGGMTGLRTALKDTTPDSDHPDQPDHPYKDVLQDTNGTPNIVGMPRTELAQQITMARAGVLIERVNGRAPSRQAFLGEGAYLQRPWARAATANERLALDSLIRQPDTGIAGFTPDGTPIIFAADTPPPPGEKEYNPHRYYDDHFHQPSPDKQWAEVKEFLVTQRKDKDTIYEATLATEQGSAKEIHDAEHNLATDGSNKREALGKIRTKRAGHQTMQQAVESATNGKANVDCKFLHLHDAATLEDYGDVPDAKRHTADGAVDDHDDLQKADDARRRWFALLGFPALQHLFLLSVDVEFSFSSSEFDKLLTAAVTTSDFVVRKEHAIFLLLRPHIDENAHPLEHVKLSEQPWTLAKARRSFGAGPDCFMPATLEELLECYPDDDAPKSAQSLRERGTIDQFNGVIDLEAAAVSGNESSLRFSIETIDIHAAAESDMRRDAAMASAADLTAPDGASIPPIPEVTAGAAVERKLRTAGLQLLDQWRGSVVVKQFSRSLAATKPGAGTLVLDADDLAVGYRLDVGFRTGEKSELSWACLTNREVRYSLPGSTQALDKAVETILAAPNVDVGKKRVELDGSVLAMPTRLLQNANGKKTGFAESVLATWQGDPLGLEANEQRVGVCPGGLALNVDFNLPSGQSDERPPKLRFGVPYWLGARTVFLGGVCLPLHDKNPSRLTAHNLYKAGLQDGMLLPRRQELRRFLRHEWIDPPMVAVPWADIVSELGITAKPVGEKPTKPTAGQSPETYCRGLDGETMVVRLPTPTPASAADEPDDPWRFKPLKSQRAVCAPGVDFTFAHLHGVFDAEVNPTKKSGLAGVDYDLSRGGFPAISPEAAIEEASIVYARTNCDQKPASGIAIFRGRKFAQPTRAAELYYPDPAARSLVIGLRYHWTTDTYLTGAPIIVPLYGGGNSGILPREYPDAMPVLITVEAVAPGKDGRLTSYQQLEKRAGGKPIRVVPIDKSKPATGHNAAIEVTIKLAPVEDFCVDVWAIPDLKQLAQWFDAPESVAFSCAATDYKQKPDAASEKEKLLKAMPGKISESSYSSPPQTIRRNNAVVSSEAVARTAAALYAALCLKPVPELSSVRTLRAVHAVEKPPSAPKLVGSKPPELRLLRVDETKRQDIMGPSKDHDWHTWRHTDDSLSATDVLAGGDICIDRAVHETLELRVMAAAPNGRPIDNPLLGRTLEDRSRGLWPDKPEKSALRDTAASRRLYGFDVDEQGRVTFARETIVFNKWSLQPNCHLAQETVSLVDLTAESEQPVPKALQQQCATPPAIQSASPKAGNGRRSAQRYFSDGTARRVNAYFAATSRTARLIPERSTYPDTSQRERDQMRLFSFEPDAKSKPEKPVMTSTIIRSIVRPLALPPKHVLPAFAWTHGEDKYSGELSVSRRTRIRIPFDRPAMTSGEDERIGIVLWPPNILGAATKPGPIAPLPTWTETDLTVGKLRRAEPLETDDPQNKLVDLQVLGQRDALYPSQAKTEWRAGYFSDEDLGPGGAYISRWGADPIHDAGEVTWFMHPRAFRDVPNWTETALDSIAAESMDSGALWPDEKEKRYTPRLVENILMPIPGDDPSRPNASSGKSEQDDRPKEPDFMLVSLLTYAPRFDVDSETWYIDVEIDPGTAPDPFLRLGLVRYQPHANRRIQVSYPVAEWIQVVSYCRDVKLERDDETVVVTVKGPVLAKTTSEAPLTIIRASLIERRVSEYGVAYERPARKVVDGKLGEPIEQVSYANSQGDELIWQGAFDLPEKNDSEDIVSYAIFIEECYRMRRATFDQEPVREEPPFTERDDPAYWRDSGPRFAARIDL